MTGSIEKSKSILSQLLARGITDFVICPGGRCAPLIAVLENIKGIKLYNFFDERSASFFALGLGKKNNRPAVVVTTSGTAVSECLSAFIEAHYSSVPIIILSADRPKSYRGSGAPQAIHQSKIFSDFQTHAYDLEESLEIASLNGQVHINICLDEPLIDSDDCSVSAGIGEFKDLKKGAQEKVAISFKKPLVIVGALGKDEAKEAYQFIKSNELVCYLESGSQLKNYEDLKVINQHSSKIKIKDIEEAFDGVIRIGSVPTLRLWRDLEKSLLPVINFSNTKYSGLSRIKNQASSMVGLNAASCADISYSQDISGERQSYTYDDFPSSEPSFINKLSKLIPNDAVLFIGNSLVIREWDDYAAAKKGQSIYVNRGVNGIDGLISTGLGCAEEGRELWIVVGDQSALYDLQALWVCKQLPDIKIRVVVINNSGGKIFEKLFKQESLQNSHQHNFSAWAEMFNLDYQLISKDFDLEPINAQHIIIECRIDNNQTKEFLKSIK